MNLSDLIDDLSEAIYTHGNVPIIVRADHAQTPEYANYITVVWMNQDNEVVHADDIEKYDDLTKCLEIS